jgi:hypothetical protein
VREERECWCEQEGGEERAGASGQGHVPLTR